jgi:hypothetical protein
MMLGNTSTIYPYSVSTRNAKGLLRILSFKKEKFFLVILFENQWIRRQVKENGITSHEEENVRL